MDYAIPTILVAQAIGRWGNFFNQEVFGHFVSADAWNFLPFWITNNMQNNGLPMGQYYYNGELIKVASNGIIVPDGAIASPLFLVEGIVNIMFFFIITKGLPAVFGKHLKNGDQSFFYFIAYGIVRAVLEPLRNPQFIMGNDGVTGAASKSDYKSLMMAIAFIAAGVLLILINHILQYHAEKGKFDKAPKWKAVFVEAGEQAVMDLNLEQGTATAKADTIDLSSLRAKERELNGEEKEETTSNQPLESSTQIKTQLDLLREKEQQMKEEEKDHE